MINNIILAKTAENKQTTQYTSAGVSGTSGAGIYVTEITT